MQDDLVRRARPLLGTRVSVQVRGGGTGAHAAIEAAFSEIALIHRLMSAHTQDSDLAKLARARSGERITLHPHTIAVLRLAQAWHRASAGAFDAQRAGERLAALGRRPGLVSTAVGGRLADLQFEEGAVRVAAPLRLDLGGIAKGYAVDQAVAVLQSHGIVSGLVNAGGDLRAFGPHAWRVDVQHPDVWARTQRLLRLRDAAIATSVHDVQTSDFVATRRRPAAWRRCTVLARDCASADALTKWALQQPAPSLQLRAALTRAGARLWRD